MEAIQCLARVSILLSYRTSGGGEVEGESLDGYVLCKVETRHGRAVCNGKVGRRLSTSLLGLHYL